MPDDIRIPKHRYDDLINSAQALVSVTNNAVATILGDTPYESMLRGPSEALQSALNEVPGAEVWNGSFHEKDVEYKIFRHHSQLDHSGPDAGVKATHKPTGLSVESYSKPNALANQASAASAIQARVERYALDQGLK